MKRVGLVPEKDLQYAILVETAKGMKWVTELKDKVAYWNDGDEAHLSRDRESLERICMGLAFHGTPAFTVIVPNYLTGMKNDGGEDVID